MALIGVEELVQQRVAEERKRLERESGLVSLGTNHFRKPVEREFTKDQHVPALTLLP